MATKTIDAKSIPEFPEVSSADLAAVDIKKGTLAVKLGGKVLNIYNQQTAPIAGAPKLTVLLLHGQSFTSQNWVDISLLQYLACWGFHAVALDLPGYGHSREVNLGGASRGDFLAAVVETLDIKPVIVSPSMSGGFALPYLFQDPAKSLERAIGYIPIAPVMTGEFKTNYPRSQLPTLIVYGTKDEQLGTTSCEDLKVLPNSRIAPIPEAGHACYLNQPAWSRLLTLICRQQLHSARFPILLSDVSINQLSESFSLYQTADISGYNYEADREDATWANIGKNPDFRAFIIGNEAFSQYPTVLHTVRGSSHV